MGRYKFRLSDMMPNSWFYKLKDTSRAAAATTTKHPSKRLLSNPKPTPTAKNQQSNSNSNSFPQTNQLYIPNRPSYYISSNRPQTEHLPTSPARRKASDTHFPLDPPRKSKKNHRHLHRRNSSNNSSSNNNKPTDSSSSSASTPDDIIIDMKSLPPIHTKPAKKREADQLDGKQIMLRRRRAQQGLHRIKVRPSTPKAEVKTSRKSSRRLAESVVIVKKSADPKRDFKESMVEMIVENHIRGPKDLEELLACYLSLNSDEYHGLIVKVFEEIWIDLVKQ